MSDPVPQFFFSYSRADRDKYLDRFFEDLRKRVADRSGLAIEGSDADAEEMLNKVGFRDRHGVKTGQDWKAKIGAAMQHNGVLVCLYSPNFFSYRQTKQFCGREFTAFLRRHPDMKDAPGAGEIPGTRHILPILWLSLHLLKKQGLPPNALRLITWALDSTARERLNDSYLKSGLRRIIIGQGFAYEDMLDHFADRIREVARNPLPPLPAPPDIERLPSAWARLEENDVGPASKDPTVNSVARSATRGPAVVRVIEVRRSTGADEWAPYGEHSIPALFEEIANRRELDNRPPLALEWLTLDPTFPDFAVRISGVLQAATQKSLRPILVVDPQCLANEPARAALVALLGTPWRAGFLVPVHAEDKNAVRLIEQYRDRLKSAAHSDWLFRIAVGDQTEFRTAAASVAGNLLFRIVTTDEVWQSPPNNDGPPTLPRIANQ